MHQLQTNKNAEGELFRKIAEQGHYAGRTKPTATRQGIYAAAPSGLLLASINSNKAEDVAKMLAKALAKWNELTRKERLLSEEPQRDIKRQFRCPEDGLVLRVNSRDLPREKVANDWRANAWNQDYAWFKKDEARKLLPSELKHGAQFKIPEFLIKRLARLNLVDNVCGQTVPYEEKNVEKAQLTCEITKIDGDIVSVKFEGESRTSAVGKWPVGGFKDMDKPTEQKRGFEARLLGFATYSIKSSKFISFELVAIGTRWGGTQYNFRSDDLEPAPIGILFTLAGKLPSETVTPAFIWSYGWK